MDLPNKSTYINPVHYNGAFISHIVDDPENQIDTFKNEIVTAIEIQTQKSYMTKMQFKRILKSIFIIISMSILIIGIYMFISVKKYGYKILNKNNIVCRTEQSIFFIIIGSILTIISVFDIITYFINFYNQLDD